MGVLLTLKINPADMGYIIGRKGQTAQAIRTLLRIVGAKNNARVNLKIYEPEGARQSRRQETPSDTQADPHADIDTSALDDLSI
jgi:predicted RNA-binding protein Jag